MKAMIICEQGLEECEALIVYDLLKRASIETDLIGFDNAIISSHGLSFNPTKNFNNINPKDYDCLILPGGMPGTNNLEKNQKVNNTIDDFVANKKLICAICAAPSLLIKKGYLSDNEFTCYPGFEQGYVSTHEKVHVHNNIITSNGVGSAIEFGLAIIEKLINKEKADSIKKAIQY